MENMYNSRIALVGYMGCGKSYLGRELAKILQIPFYDLDQVIGQVYGCNQADLMRRKGELAFREAEKKALDIVLKRESFVLACGGGTPAYYDNMKRMLSRAQVIFLDCKNETLVERLKPERQSRPLIETVSDEELPSFIAKHLFERRPYYEKANMRVSADQITAEKLKEAIVDNR